MRISDWSADVCSTDVAFEPFPDLVLGGVRLLLHQVDRAHHHAGRAEAALQAVMLLERRSHRMQLVAVRQALDRGYLGAVGLHRQQHTGLGGVAVYVVEEGTGVVMGKSVGVM